MPRPLQSMEMVVGEHYVEIIHKRFLLIEGRSVLIEGPATIAHGRIVIVVCTIVWTSCRVQRETRPNYCIINSGRKSLMRPT